MARKIGVSEYRGRQLLEMHRRTFPGFWSWSDALLLEAFSKKRLQTCFGWTLHVGNDANPRSLKNFPMQAHGAEMMRVACIMATERGVNVCCPVHDALLVEGAAGDIDEVVRQTQDAMRRASEVILPGFPLKTDAKIVRYPDRYTDPRGVKMWGLVWDTIATEPLPNRVGVAG
jgi:DNA polymerase I-like protein with 3'-5' exonuclease and polymerase domains